MNIQTELSATDCVLKFQIVIQGSKPLFQQESPADSTSSAGVGDEDTELMMDELLATPPLSSTSRGFPPRRRLEPLPEEEDTDSPATTPASSVQKETPSPEQVSHSRQGFDRSCLAHTFLLHTMFIPLCRITDQSAQLCLHAAVTNCVTTLV